MILCRIKIFRIFVVLVFFFYSKFGFANHLDQYFKYMAEGQHLSAMSILKRWTPKSIEEKLYKKYFIALQENKAEVYWDLYQSLAKNKKMLKLQHESIKKILQLDVESPKNLTMKFKGFNAVAKQMLKRIDGQKEALEYEFKYLKWILEKKNYTELCRTERSRWLSQPSLSLAEIKEGLKTCPVSYDDFIYRIRMLVFSGEEKKAAEEINQYSAQIQLSDWLKAYLEAILKTHMGDPVAAFQIIIPYKNDLKNKKDYYLNLFYMAQRAGEQKKAEEVINELIAATDSKKTRNELLFQKAFLYYQIGRYSEAVTIFSNLVESHPSHKKKIKSEEYDELTWLKAWCLYLDKRYDEAFDQLMLNRKWASDKARTLYWLAQTEWAMDNRGVAVAYYKQLALPVSEGKYFTHYNYLAWLRFEAYKSFAVTELLRNNLNLIKLGKGMYALPDNTTNPLDLVEEYRPYFEDIGATDEGAESFVEKDAVPQDPDDTVGIKVNTPKELKNELSWADDLVRWGYGDIAKWHLFEVEKKITKKNAEALMQYSLNNEFYNRAVAIGQNIFGPGGRKLSLKNDSLIWRSMYPKAYRKNVEAEAKKRKISPVWIWSIMKAETQFKKDAISPVGAVGLMQFMPYTSVKVAALMDVEHASAQLLEPENAVKYGAMYLKKLSDELGGELPLVAAAYNGGPHRVKLWLKNLKATFGNHIDYDVFIEHIPFAETRTYVKRVINSSLIYKKLYENKLGYNETKWLMEPIGFRIREPISLKEEWPRR